ncbi:MAG: SOS response-associated peptidase [Acidimicrobiales bacterium]
MCGRFVSTTPADQLAAYFGAEAIGETILEPSYNVAPTNQVYTVINNDEGRVLETAKWGLIPFWAKDAKIGNKMINARAETVATKNAFRKAFQRRRCIIPSDGFYEWVKLEGHEKKTPMHIHRVDGDPFAFAGLWDTWRDPEGELIRSCTILTGSPNEKIAEIHNRMPILLPPGAWDEWLDPDLRDPDHLEKFLVPAPAELMDFYPVSTEVNNPRTRGEQLIQPVSVAGDE